MADLNSAMSLLCRVSGRLCALPLEHVVEILRPRPVEVMPGTPDFVLGLSVVRGEPVPIVDAARLFGDADPHSTRFVIVKAGERRVGIAVNAVLGIRAIDPHVADYLPPLIRNAEADVVDAIGTLDAELLVVFRAAHMVPDELLELLEAEGRAS